MRDQEQNLNDEETGGNPVFSMPGCCGPMMDRMSGSGVEKIAGQGWSACEEMMSKMTEGENPKGFRPMTGMFKEFSRKRGFGLLAVIPGLLLVFVGVAIVFEPQILVWMLAAFSITAGLMLVAAAVFFRRLASGYRT